MGIVEKFRLRDRMMRAMTKDGKFRATVVKATDLANDARERHGLNPLASVIMAELLMGALLSASNLQEDERISLRLEVNGEIKSAVAEANMMGEVRGYLGNPDPVALSEEPTEMKKLAIGIGLLHVTRTHAKIASPTQSTVMLEHGNIAKDLTHYFAVSEQIPTAIRLEVKFKEDFSIAHALGFMIQAMPGIDINSGENEEKIIEIENNIIDLAYPSEIIEAGQYIEDVMAKLLKGEEFIELSKTPVDFFCRCSKEKFLSSLALLGVDELSTLDRDHEELRCHYCNKTYLISQEEIQKEIERLVQGTP
jgi:molecular chaperone Hsp33